MKRLLGLGVLLMTTALTGCGGSGDDSGDDGGSADADVNRADGSAGVAPNGPVAAPGMTIPDPGTGAPNWIQNGEDHGTPQTAHPVGVQTVENPGYIQGTADAVTGNFFFVFRAGPALTQFSVSVSGTDYVHLHDGTGLMYGAVIAPTVSTPTSGTWPVTPNGIYVLELHFPGGGFF